MKILINLVASLYDQGLIKFVLGVYAKDNDIMNSESGSN